MSCLRMPRRTKQYGWQCSECDKDPASQQPSLQHTQHIDLEAPRASRARDQSSRVNSVILSDSDADSLKNVMVDTPVRVDTPATNKVTPVKKSKKKVKSETPRLPVESTPAPAASCDISSSSIMSDTPASTASPSSSATPVKRKRGRPVGWRKYKDGEGPPPRKRDRSKKNKSLPNTSSSEPATQESKSSITVKEPKDNLEDSPTKTEVLPNSSDTKKDENDASREDNDVTPSLPPKKFFKSKAAQKESDVTSPTPGADNDERTNFRNWLDAKLSPIKAVNTSNISDEPEEHPSTNGVEGKENLDLNLGEPMHEKIDLGRGLN